MKYEGYIFKIKARQPEFDKAFKSYKERTEGHGIVLPQIAKKFNQSFQEFESLLKNKTGGNDSTDFRSSLSKMANINSYIKDNFGLIEDLYALRNVFSHRMRGEYVADIKEIALTEINKIINSIKIPRIVIQEFGKEVYTADEDQLIRCVVEKMKQKTYTHTPVYSKEGKCLGVFAYSSLFEWLADKLNNETNMEIIFDKIYMRDINKKYLNSPSVNFDWVSETKSIYEIIPQFEYAVNSSKRLDCLLITKNGKCNEKISGIITSYDLPSIKNK